MAKGVLNIDLDNIQIGITELEKYSEEIDQALEDALAEIASKIEKRIQSELSGYGLGGSTITNDINIEFYDDGISISINNDHWLFVEYGTGIKGESSPHPNPLEWEYDTNAHGVKGWWYPTTESDPNRVKRVGADGNLYAWTQGMPSRPFFYKSYLYARRIATRTVNKHLRRIGL